MREPVTRSPPTTLSHPVVPLHAILALVRAGASYMSLAQGVPNAGP